MPPLDGRRIWFVGIGGAGPLGVRAARRAPGAPRSAGGTGSTRRTSSRCGGIEVEIAPEPVVPRRLGGRSSRRAYPGRAGRRRARSCSPSSSGCATSIVVAGAHGKTTTAAMIAFVLRELGRDPALADRRRGAAARRQRRARARAGSSSRATSRTARSRRCGPRSPSSTNVDLDHHTEFASLAEVEALFDDWLARVPHVVRGEELAPYDGELARAGRAQPPQRGRGARRARARRRRCATRPRPVLARVRGRRPPVRASRRGGRRRRRTTTTRHHPTEVAATIAAARRARRAARAASSSSRTCTRARATSRASSAAALAGADDVAVTDVYAAREAAGGGRDAASSSSTRCPTRGRDARSRGRRPLEDGRALSRAPRARRRRAAHDRRRRRRPRPCRPAARRTLAMKIEEGVRSRASRRSAPGARALVRAAGDTRRARARRSRSRESGTSPSQAVGLGSNLLVADEGVDALVLKLARRARRGCDVRGELLVAGGGATERGLPPPRARRGARRVRVRVRDPRHVGGGVRMNAGAYGGDFGGDPRARARRRRATARDWLTPERARPRLPPLGPRHGPGGRAASSSGSRRGRSTRSRRPSPSCRRSGRRPSRRTSGRSAACSRTRSTSSTRGPDARGVRAEGPSDRRRADLAACTRTSSRTRAARRPPTRSR